MILSGGKANMKVNRFIVRIFFILILIQTTTLMAFGKTEQQKYRVVHTGKEFEIRFYPSATLATVRMEANNYKELSGDGFRKLAGYIFGGNKSDTKIAMTAPVHMDIQPGGSSMSFVMPSSWEKNNLPSPNDPGVLLEKSSDEYVAAIRFGGYASDADIRNYSDKLKKMLDEQGISYHGNFRYLGYNPPFQPFGRRNEIIVSVTWKEKKGN